MDNHHVTVSGSQISCGVAQLFGISSDEEKVLYALANYLYHPSRGSPVAFAMWSDTPKSNGDKLAYLVGEKWGKLEETDWVENPKTSNNIKVFVWEIPHKEFKEWYVKQRVKRAKKV